METGIYVLNKIRLDLGAEAGRKGARLLRKQLDNPENLLVVLLIGTNVAAYTATFATRAMFDLAGAAAYAGVYTVAVATPILFIFGENVPKNLFRRSAETLVYRLAWLLGAASVLLNACGAAPLVRAFTHLLMWIVGRGRAAAPAMVPQGMGAIVAEGAASGALTHMQSMMAERVMRIREVTLADVMTPMHEVAKADVDVSRDELIETIRGHEFSRLPLMSPDGQVAGILDTYDILTGTGDERPADKAAEAPSISASMPVTDALYRLQREHDVMAVVADDRGRHVGIVTVKDLVEEIVGEIEAW
jgi:putative hemolysin